MKVQWCLTYLLNEPCSSMYDCSQTFSDQHLKRNLPEEIFAGSAEPSHTVTPLNRFRDPCMYCRALSNAQCFPLDLPTFDLRLSCTVYHDPCLHSLPAPSRDGSLPVEHSRQPAALQHPEAVSKALATSQGWLERRLLFYRENLQQTRGTCP